MSNRSSHVCIVMILAGESHVEKWVEGEVRVENLCRLFDFGIFSLFRPRLSLDVLNLVQEIFT